MRRHPQLHRPAGHLLGQPAGASSSPRRRRPPAAAARPPRPATARTGSTAARSSSAGIGACRHQLVGTVPAGTAPTVRLRASPNRAGRVAVQAARSSASGRSSRPSTVEGVAARRPQLGDRDAGRAAAAARTAAGSDVVTTARAADSLNSAVNGSPSRCEPRADAVAQRGLGEGLRQAAVGEVVRGADQALRAEGGEQLAQRALGGQVDRRRPPAEVAVHDATPRPSRRTPARVSPSSSTVSPVRPPAAGDAACGRPRARRARR